MLESELNFLLVNLPSDYKDFPSIQIRQGFISGLPSPLRIRESEGKFTMTKKHPVSPDDGSRYIESEIELSKEEFEKFWPICQASLSKRRYKYPLYDGLVAEIDIFQDKLEGLVYAEVEFPDEELRKNFKKPDWFDIDITQEKWVANSELSKLNYSQVEKIIGELELK